MRFFRKRSVDRDTVFRLLETADNFVKYGRPRARERAMDRIREARELALELGDDELVRLATIRMGDLDRGKLDETLVPVERIGPRQPAPEGTGDMRPDADRVPPNQTVTGGWPVLHTGPIPRFDPSAWRLKVWGAVERRVSFTYDELRALGATEMMSDFHCVTGWSKLDNRWAGVWFRDAVAPASPRPDATTVLAYAEHYSANIPFEVLMQEGFLAWGHGGADLTPEHGYPLRLVVPSRYGWKSVKWLDGLQLLTRDERGYWEVRGYHNRADPWREERYASAE